MNSNKQFTVEWECEWSKSGDGNMRNVVPQQIRVSILLKGYSKREQRLLLDVHVSHAASHTPHHPSARQRVQHFVVT